MGVGPDTVAVFQGMDPIAGSPNAGPDGAIAAGGLATSHTPSTPTPGSIVLARHGEPALSRRIRLNAEGYRRWWAAYEEGGILAGQTPPAELLDLARHADIIFASTRRRAVETAEAIVGTKIFIRDPMFVEAPLPPPPLPAFMTFNPQSWGVIARLVWWLGYHGGQETRAEAQGRARAASERLSAAAQNGADVLLLAHGFFNLMVGLELKRLGWRRMQDRGFKYWATRRFERP
jgi:broad specificity phosphatase PhoE